MYEAYMAEVLSRSETEQITRRIERRRVALERSALAPAPIEQVVRREPRAVRMPQPTAPCVGCPA
ncbi:hypothetical protein ET475_10495 [Microbacterium protaetiae]|uniref:Uncharacterized protein n=1 Tax=Microbacterium protaetiae TaxID=2509458 RepID=A0A4P6EE04_9MICO|nr:hypothetical protein [Microbacterium protaetiae]QAY60374.1 hypothetical protein ET475_10495 [Microbacterium protaetiae]